MIIERWICKKCNKKWIYPIEKCLYCKGNIEIERGEKLKVIGITKVFIPSPMHPITPYNIIMLEDEHSNKMPKKTMKEYKIGDFFEEKKSVSTNSVSIAKIKYDVYESIKNAVDLIGGVKAEENSKIMIIPNIEVAAYEYQGITTSPKVLDGVIKYLLLRNVKKENISVGAQSYADTEEAVKKTGILEICKKHNISFVDFSKHEFIEKGFEGKKYNISREVLDKDIIINLPVLKTSTGFIVAAALENIQRIADKETQKEICSDIVKNMVNINKSIPKYLTIADGTIGLQGNGPLNGEPSFLNIVMASYDPLALDVVFSEIGMLNKPPYSTYFNGIIEVIGEEIDALKFGLKEPQKKFNIHYDIEIIDGKCCQLCYNAAVTSNQKLIGLKGEKCTMVLGNDFTLEDVKDCNRLIAFGDSSISKLNALNIRPMIEIYGNPPDVMESVLILKKVLSNKGKVKINTLDMIKASLVKNISKVVN